MRVPSQRVGALDTLEQSTMLFTHQESPAVGAVHMQPKIMFLRNIGDGIEWIERADRSRAARSHDTEWIETFIFCDQDCTLEFLHIHAPTGIQRNLSHLLSADADHAGRARDTV